MGLSAGETRVQHRPFSIGLPRISLALNPGYARWMSATTGAVWE
jgi:hypothetical protein